MQQTVDVDVTKEMDSATTLACGSSYYCSAVATDLAEITDAAMDAAAEMTAV